MIGNLQKMGVSLAEGSASDVQYQLRVGENSIPLNELLGHTVSLKYTGAINCIYCSRKTSKSFNQGYCYPCFKTLARCDQCILKPETCHFHKGTCREPEWAQNHCMQSHYVYLANSSGVKVGITRGDQLPTRWIDQGATQALPIYRVDNRYISGLVEVLFKSHISDKTNWRAMLKGEPEARNLKETFDEIHAQICSDIEQLQSEHGIQAIDVLNDAEQIELNYPVMQYPEKVTSANFDKDPVLEGLLTGIKGQYLMFENTVINIRKFSGYEIEFVR